MIVAGPIRLDASTREAFVKGDRLLLTDGEFDVLRELARLPYATQSRWDLLGALPGDRSRVWLNARLAGLSAKLKRVGVPCSPVADEQGVRLFERVGARS